VSYSNSIPSISLAHSSSCSSLGSGERVLPLSLPYFIVHSSHVGCLNPLRLPQLFEPGGSCGQYALTVVPDTLREKYWLFASVRPHCARQVSVVVSDAFQAGSAAMPGPGQCKAGTVPLMSHKNAKISL
jgi:hypothetical protein